MLPDEARDDPDHLRERAEADEDESEQEVGMQEVGMHAGTFCGQPAIP